MRWGKRIVATLVVVVVSSALMVVVARHESRLLFVELQAQKASRDDLVIEYGQLQLEESAWATHGRVEQVAREKLKMRIPEQDAVVLLKK